MLQICEAKGVVENSNSRLSKKLVIYVMFALWYNSKYKPYRNHEKKG